MDEIDDFVWHWDRTDARLAADAGMGVVDGLMEFASDDRGNRHAKQVPLYLAAVTFSYAVWENFVEDLADELVDSLARCLDPGDIPVAAREVIEDGATNWQLSVSPGWRGLWVKRIRALTKGSERAGSWGLNSASKPNSDRLFRLLGLDPIPARIPAPEPTGGTTTKRIPDNVAISKDGTVDVKHVLSELVTIRGEAVHTAATSDPLFKNQVHWWSNFVRALYAETDRHALAQCAELVGDDTVEH